MIWRWKKRGKITATASHTGKAEAEGGGIANSGNLTLNQYLTAPLEAPATADHEVAIAAYAVRLGQSYGRADLEVLTPLSEQGEHPPMELRQIFVPQDVRAGLPQRELPKELMRRLVDSGELSLGVDLPPGFELHDGVTERTLVRSQQQPRQHVLDVLAAPDSDRTVLLGDPGAGKSTLARYLALALVGVLPAEQLRPLEGRLPLLVELRRYAEERWRERTFEEFLDYLHVTEGLSVPPDVLRARLKTGQALVVFDGLDEIFDPVVRIEVSRRIGAFATRYLKVRVVVTSRVIGYQGAALNGAGFAPYTLQDLTDTQISQFAHRWYRSACPHDEPLRQRLERRLTDAVSHSRPVRELARNPMLLTILAIIGRRQSLPRDRQGVYRHAVTVLVAHWDQDVKLLKDKAAPEALAVLGAEERHELLRLLARRMQDGESGIAGNHIHGRELEEIFCTYLEEYDMPRVQATAAARALVAQLRERNFILSRYGGEVYGFVHRAFLEYLAATDIAYRYKENREWSPAELIEEVFLRHADDPAWREVLLLLVGQLNESDASAVIDFLLDLHHERSGPGSDDQMLALAIRALAEVRKVGKLHRQSIAIAQALVFVTESRQVPLIGGALRSLLPVLSTFNEQWVGRSHYLRWYRRRGVFLLLANNALDIPFYLCTNSLLPRLVAEFSPSEMSRSSALEVLAERWHHETEVLALVCRAATGVLHAWPTSFTAVDVAHDLLARYWPDDPEAREIVGARTADDTAVNIWDVAHELHSTSQPDVAEALPQELTKMMSAPQAAVRRKALLYVSFTGIGILWPYPSCGITPRTIQTVRYASPRWISSLRSGREATKYALC